MTSVGRAGLIGISRMADEYEEWVQKHFTKIPDGEGLKTVLSDALVAVVTCGPCNDGICDWMGCSLPGLCSCEEEHTKVPGSD